MGVGVWVWVCVVEGDGERGERREAERYNQVSITADKLISNHTELTNQSMPSERDRILFEDCILEGSLDISGIH